MNEGKHGRGKDSFQGSRNAVGRSAGRTGKQAGAGNGGFTRITPRYLVRFE